MSACLRGDINETILADNYEDARRLAYTYSRHVRQGQLLPRNSGPRPGSGQDADSRSSTGCRTKPAFRWSPPTTRTICARTTRARTKSCMCIQTGKTMTRSRTACASTTPEFYLKTRDEMMELFGELEDAVDRTWEIAQRCHVKLEKVKEPFPQLRRSGRAHHRHLFRIRGARRASKSAARAWKRCAPKGSLKHDLAGIRRAPGSRDPDDPADEVLRLLPDRLGLHPLREIAAAFPSARAADRPPAAWSATPWRSPISIRCSTACCSSAS